MKIIQQNEKVIAYIGKDDTNERKIIKMIENVKETALPIMRLMPRIQGFIQKAGFCIMAKRRQCLTEKQGLCWLPCRQTRRGL